MQRITYLIMLAFVTIFSSQLILTVSAQQPSLEEALPGYQRASFSFANRSTASSNTYWGLDYDAPEKLTLTDVKDTADGGVIVVGTYGPLWEGQTPWVMKVNADGSIAWSQRLQGTHGYAAAVGETLDGAYLIGVIFWAQGGSGEGDAFIVKLSAMGAVLWQKTYGDATRADSFIDMERAQDGNFLMVLRSQDELVKMNPAGDILWQVAFDHDIDSVYETHDELF